MCQYNRFNIKKNCFVVTDLCGKSVERNKDEAILLTSRQRLQWQIYVYQCKRVEINWRQSNWPSYVLTGHDLYFSMYRDSSRVYSVILFRFDWNCQRNRMVSCFTWTHQQFSQLITSASMMWVGSFTIYIDDPDWKLLCFKKIFTFDSFHGLPQIALLYVDCVSLLQENQITGLSLSEANFQTSRW